MGDHGDMTNTNPSHQAASYALDSPIGPIGLGVDLRGRLARLEFADPTSDTSSGDHEIIAALAAYFDGELDALGGIETAVNGTEFQQRVWAALRRIPVGETASYADLAVEVGSPRAVRAVGRANATNPVGVVVPCHRVVRSDGSLGGYGGGLDRKRWLLAHEGAIERELVDAG